MRTLLLFALAAAIAACATAGRDYRTQYAGSLPLVIENQTDAAICEARIAPAGQSASSSRNWLDGSLRSGQSREFDVKAGSYALEVRPCGSAGRRRELPGLALSGPTEIILFDQEPPRPSGGRAQVLTLRVPAPPPENDAMMRSMGVGQPCTSPMDCPGGTLCDLETASCQACGPGAACRSNVDCCGGLFCDQGTCG